MKKIILLLALLFLGIPANADGEYHIEFGILEDRAQGFELITETTKIPYVTKAEGQFFGAIIDPPDSEQSNRTGA